MKSLDLVTCLGEVSDGRLTGDQHTGGYYKPAFDDRRQKAQGLSPLLESYPRPLGRGTSAVRCLVMYLFLACMSKWRCCSRISTRTKVRF